MWLPTNRGRLQHLRKRIGANRAILMKESVALLCLALTLLTILVVLSIKLPLRIDASVDTQQTAVQLGNWAETEYKDTFASRRLQANANISYRSGGPADFSIRLFLRGDEGLKGAYLLPLMLNGIAIDPLNVTAGLHEYQLEYRLVPAAWNPGQGNIIQITMPTPQGTTTAPLPVALTRVVIEPISASSSLNPGLLLADILLFAALYLALRIIFVKRFWLAVSGLLIGVLAVGLFAAVLPAETLYMAQQFGLHPKRTAALLLAIPLVALGFSRISDYIQKRYPRRAAVGKPTEATSTSASSASPKTLVRDLTLVFIVALGFRLIWALLVPPWQTPDEGAHFSYVAHIVESVELPGIGTPKYGGPGYSVEFNNSWNNTLFNRISTVGLPRTPEFAFLPPSYDYEIARDYQAPAEERHNGAGGTATPYPPLYYLIIALPYKLFQNEPIISRLFASRIVSGIFGALGCIFGYLMAYEIRRERLWGLSVGLCMALLPMYTFVSISVNNDTAMICATTALIWTAVRTFQQQQVSQRLLWAMGIISGCILLIKPTGIVVVALVGVALVVRQWPIVRRPWRICWPRTRATAHFIVPLIGLYTPLILLRILLNRASTGTSSVAGMNIVLAPTYSFWSYLQNEYTAGGSYFFWLFVKTFWGAFGWLEIYMPDWIYSVMLIFCALGIVGLVLGFVRRRQERRWTLLLLGLIIGQLAFLFIVADYALSYSQLGIGLGLQGRYLFPVLAPILLLLLGGWHILSGGRKLILYLAPFGALLLQLASLTTIITRYYGITFGW